MPAPAAPTDLTATPVSAGQIRLDWQDNSQNETGFKLERRKKNPDGTWTAWTQVAQTGINMNSYGNLGLSSQTTYQYRVRAYSSAGGMFNSAYSNEAEATTL